MTTEDADEQQQQKTKCLDFYFSLITFEVENVLFRVPRHSVETESDVFKEMFPLPSPNDPSADGMSDEKPLVLQGIAAQDFHALLRVLLDPTCGWQEDLNRKEWTSVLHLAHLWKFDHISSLAIDKLDKSLYDDPVSKVVLAKMYGITNWLRPAYFDLAMERNPLTLEEANKLGMDCVVKMNKVRELRYKWIIEDGDMSPPEPIAPTANNHSGPNPACWPCERPLLREA